MVYKFKLILLTKEQFLGINPMKEMDLGTDMKYTLDKVMGDI